MQSAAAALQQEELTAGSSLLRGTGDAARIEAEKIERARRRGRRGSVSAECSNETSRPSGEPSSVAHASTGGPHSARDALGGTTEEERTKLRQWLSGHFLFSSLGNEASWNALLQSVGKVTCSHEQDIVTQNDADARFMYVVNKGEFGVWLNNSPLAGVVYSEPGTIFGELAIMYQCPRQATVRCISKDGGELFTIDRQAFKQVMMDQEGASKRSASYLGVVKRNWVLKDTLSDLELEKLCDVLCEEKYDDADAVIVAQGERFSSARSKFYFVAQGSCRVERNGQLVRKLGIGSYFGERSLIDRTERTATVFTAEAGTMVLSLDATNFERLLRKPCLRLMTQQIQTGYAPYRSSFIVEDRRYPTSIPALMSKRFDSCRAFSRFTQACGEDAAARSAVFWVVGQKYRTSVPSLVGRAFPNVESYVAFLSSESTPASPAPLVSPPSAADAANDKAKRAFDTARKRGRRNSVSGESGVENEASKRSPLGVAEGQRLLRKAGSSSASDPANEALLREMISKHFLFADLSPAELEVVAGEIQEQHFKQGDVVIVQDDPEADFFYVVKQGTFVVEKDGKRMDNVVYREGSSFGELALMYFCPRQATVICDSNQGTLYCLNRAAFRRVLVGARSSVRNENEQFLAGNVELFRGWPHDDLARVADVAEEVSFKPGQCIITERDTDYNSMKLFIVKSGNVDVYINGELIRTIGKGGVFGERAVLNRLPRSASCVASQNMEEDVICIALDVPAFERLLGPLRSALMGKSKSYVDPLHSHQGEQDMSKPSQHNLSLNPLDKQKGPTEGWFRVGTMVYRTGIPFLNGQAFHSASDYHEFVCKQQSAKADSTTHAKLGSFFVEGREYPTSIGSLIDRSFETVSEYWKFLSL